MSNMAPDDFISSGRPNIDVAKLVEAGIVLNDQQDRARAAAYLMDEGVPFSVIVRILAEPSRRRRYIST
jgi:hypothetical protein